MTVGLGAAAAGALALAAYGLGLVPGAAAAGSTVAGQFVGTFAVGASGNATYHLPLITPPGTNGVEPELSLGYDSQTGDGHLGLGWSVRGVSAITRCDARLDLDKRRGGVTYGPNDVFCLDGQRLIATPGGTGFSPEQDPTVAITASQDLCGTGPCSFTLLNKHGETLTFGATAGAAGSRILAQGRTDGAVAVWGQDSFTDLNGNQMAFGYSSNAATGEYYLTRIDYTSNVNTKDAAQRSVVFGYSARPDPLSRYSGGSLVTTSQLLASVTTSVQGETALVYNLSYAPSAATGRSLLNSVSACDSSNNCFAPLAFGWQQTQPGFADSGQTLPGPLTVVANGQSVPIGALNDINGDGILDYALATEFADGSEDLSVWLGSATGAFTKQAYQLPGPLYQLTAQAVLQVGTLRDIDGDGLPDFSAATNNLQSRSSDLSVWHNNGSGFTQLPAGMDLPHALFTVVNGQSLASGVLADIDGDGLLDYSAATKDAGGATDLEIWKGTAGGFQDTGMALPGTLFRFANQQSMRTGILRDVNGDGILDYSSATKGPSGSDLTVSLGASDFSFSASYALPGPMLQASGSSTLDTGVLVDVNGDSIPDYSPATGSNLQIWFGTGAGFTASGIALPGPLHLMSRQSGQSASQVMAMLGNVQSDGLTRYSGARQGADGDLDVYIGNANGFSKASYALPTYLFLVQNGAVLDNGVFQDLNGDGLADVAQARGTIAGGRIAPCTGCKVWLGGGTMPDLLSTATDGFGGITSIQYAPLSTLQAPVAAPSPWPMRSRSGALYVVSGYSAQDGRGATYASTLAYSGALSDVAGRGWLGFKSITTTETATKRSTAVIYNQAVPLQQMVDHSTQYDGQGATMTVTDYQYVDLASSAQQAAGLHLIRPAQLSVQTFAGNAPAYTMVTSSQYDAYGNETLTAEPGNPTLGDMGRWTCTRYQVDTARHVLGIPRAKQRNGSLASCQNFLSAATPAWPADGLRWSTRTYDANYNVTGTSDYDDTTGSFLVTQYGVDAYGNTTSTTDTAGNVSRMVYDTVLHSFPAQHVSPALTRQGTAYNLTSTFLYDARFGIMVKEVDPNGNTFQQTLDGFGRIVAQLGPSPSSSSQVTLQQMTMGSDAHGNYSEIRSRLSWGDGDSDNWTWSRRYFDGLGREILVRRLASRGGAAAVTREEVAFDSAGRAQSRSVPYFEGDPPPVTLTSHDDWNRPVTITDPAGVQTTYGYSPDGLTTTTVRAAGTADAQTAVALRSPAGLAVQGTEPNGLVRSSVYDAAGQILTIAVSDPSPRQTIFTWDSLGRPSTRRDPARGLTTWSFDPAGRLAAIDTGIGKISYGGFDPLNRPTARAVDGPNGQIATALTYDDTTYANGLGQLTGTDTGPQGGFPASSRRIGYDAYGDRAADLFGIGQDQYLVAETSTPQRLPDSYTFADGAVVSYTYGPDGQLSAIGLQPAKDGPVQTVATYGDYSALGQIQSVAYPQIGVALSRQYYPIGPSFGRLRSASATRGTPSTPVFSLNYSWNALDRLTQVQGGTKATDETFSYNDDPPNLTMGFLTGAEGPSGPLQMRYNKAGGIVRQGSTSYTYASSADQLTGSSAGDVYVFDPAGRAIGRNEAGVQFDHAYDAADRQLGLKRTDPTGSRSEAIAYDVHGDKIAATPLGQPPVHWVDGRFEVLTLASGKQGTKYISGPTGPVAAVTGTIALGSQASVPASVGPGHDLLYGGGGGRAGALPQLADLARSALIVPPPGTTAVLALALLLCAIMLLASAFPGAAPDGSRAVSRTKAMFAGFMAVAVATAPIQPALAQLAPGSNGPGVPTSGTAYFLEDHRQSIVAVFDGSGAVTARIAYLPYGQMDSANSSGTDNFRPKFAGREWNGLSGLYDFGARFYDPSIGRFLSPDAAEQYSDPYLFASSSPESFVDPDGNFAILIAIAIGAYFGAAATNHSMSPLHWDFGAEKTYAGMVVGGAIGATGAGAGAEVAEAAEAVGASGGTAAEAASASVSFFGHAAVGAAENAGYAALGGGNSKDIAENAGLGALIGGAGGLLGGGAGAEVQSAEKSEAAEVSGSGVGESEEEESCNSFVTGTLVWRSEGPVPIEQVALGDRVYAKSDPTNRASAPSLNAVVDTHYRASESITRFTVGGEAIEVTPKHRFWIEGRGWLPAEDLTAGMRLQTRSGAKLKIEGSSTRAVAPRAVWNFTVAGAHTYYVGRHAVLTHNPVPVTAEYCKLSQLPAPRTASRIEKAVFKSKLTKLIKKFGDEDVVFYDPPSGRREIDFSNYAFKLQGKAKPFRAMVSLNSFGKGTSRSAHFSFADREMTRLGKGKFNRRLAYDYSGKAKGSFGTWHHQPWSKEAVFVPRELHKSIGHAGSYSKLF
jgi:RHS repeat-associated protein